MSTETIKEICEELEAHDFTVNTEKAFVEGEGILKGVIYARHDFGENNDMITGVSLRNFSRIIASYMIYGYYDIQNRRFVIHW